jgi:ribosomal protein S18 acetylase RimI-like enzyme
MSKSFVVRLLTSADIQEVLEVHLLLFEVKYSRHTIESFLRDKYLALVMVDVSDRSKEKIIGVSVTSREWISLCSTEKRGYLSTFGILPEWRRNGLGTYLFRLTCHILRFHYNVEEIALHMLQSNRSSYGFYQSVGMNATLILPEYYNFDDSKHTAVYMRRELVCIESEDCERQDIIVSPEINHLLSKKQNVWFFYPLIFEP